MELYCKDCKYFQDGNYSRTYVSPICIVHGGDDASFMRQYICGIDKALLFKPKPSSIPVPCEPVRPA